MTPDFDQIAEQLMSNVDREYGDGAEEYSSRGRCVTRFVEALRQVWNARGTADVEKLQSYLQAGGPSGDVQLMPYLRRALRSLDHVDALNLTGDK